MPQLLVHRAEYLSALPRGGKLLLPKRELCLQREFEFADLVQQKCAALTFVAWPATGLRSAGS